MKNEEKPWYYWAVIALFWLTALARAVEYFLEAGDPKNDPSIPKRRAFFGHTIGRGR